MKKLRKMLFIVITVAIIFGCQIKAMAVLTPEWLSYILLDLNDRENLSDDTIALYNYIGKWSSSPTIASTNFNSNSYHMTSVQQAVDQWNGVTGMTSTVTLTSYITTNDDIHVYGGTLSQLTSFGIVGTTDFGVVNGYTKHNSSPVVSQFTYGGYTKYVIDMDYASVFIIYKSQGLTRYRNTTLHEMGHAYGWFGHSTNSNDVMWFYDNDKVSLTDRDKKHLLLVY